MDRQKLIKEVQQDFLWLLNIDVRKIEVLQGRGKKYRAGSFSPSKHVVRISKYIYDNKDYKDCLAHELIHACGIYNHGKEFKQVARILNEYGYNIGTYYLGRLNG